MALLLANNEDDPLERQIELEEEEFMEQPLEEEEEEEQILSIEEAYNQLLSIQDHQGGFVQQDFVQRMKATVERAYVQVEDEGTEQEYHDLAMMSLSGRERLTTTSLRHGMELLGSVFLMEDDNRDDFTEVWQLLVHLQNRLYPTNGPSKKKRRHKINRRAYPLLVAVVAHCIPSVGECMKASFLMDPTNIRIGKALYGLQCLKNQHQAPMASVELLGDFST